MSLTNPGQPETGGGDMLRNRVPALIRARLPTRGWGWLAAVCAAALMITFVKAVQLVVTQGSERREVTSRTARIQGQCNTLPDRQAREDCRKAAR